MSVVNFLRFFSYAPFGMQNTENRTFLLHPLTFWAAILHLTCFTVLQAKFKFRQFSSFLGVMPLLKLRILEIHSFPHFYLTWFDISSWHFAYDFVLLYFRSSSSVVYFRQFLLELCPFWNVKYWKYTFFSIFLLHTLIYRAEILHMNLFYCTADQVWVSLICVNVCGSYAPFANLEQRILEIHSVLPLSPTCFDILSWNFTYDFV